jgi:hypothetical protein
MLGLIGLAAVVKIRILPENGRPEPREIRDIFSESVSDDGFQLHVSR